MYFAKDGEGNGLEGKFYTEELQPVSPSLYRIEKILETKGKGRYKQDLVKWVGYKEPSWIKANQIST